jgi:Holliday junction resolvase RusA-like endonuclease
VSETSFADPPFAVAPDVVLDLPPPISVNVLRKINWREHKRASIWRDMADRYLLAAKCRSENPVKLNSIKRFEIEIVLNEDLVRVDCDNTLKLLVDYLRHRNLIEDDSPKHMRKLTVSFGHAPAGARVTIKSIAEHAAAYP